MPLRLRALLPCLLALATACGGEAKDKTGPDVAIDSATDAAADAVEDAVGDVASDAAADTASTCTGAAYVETTPPDPSRSKFALSLFHFNVEYVIGGLEYVDAQGKKHLFLNKPANEGWDNAKVEDYIVAETLLPILQLYDEHPTWGVNIELQAYMVEVMAARHPATLELLRKLATRGQVELVSFHYAAQLFLAFPAEDLRRSIALTRAIFAKHCLPLSGVVFNQEGQAGEGRQKLLLQEGYSIGIHPKNLFKYVHEKAEPFWPWYDSEGGTLIVGPGGIDASSGVEVGWDFFDDGELRAVGKNLNPYFAPTAPHDPKRVEDFEKQLAAREAAGWHLARISDYVRHLEAKKIAKKPAPPLVDGTWQPPSTDSIHRWLGGRGLLFWQDEQDNALRSGNASARMHVAAAQVLIDHARKQGHALADLAATEDWMWRRVFHSQVSDGSGVNPWLAEVQACLAHNVWLDKTAAEVRQQVLQALGAQHVAVDLEQRTVQVLADLPSPEPLQPAEAPVDVTLATEGRTVQLKWQQVAAKRWRLQVDLGPTGSLPCDDCESRKVTLGFARKQDALEYSPGLIEDEVRKYPLGAFDLLDGHDQVYLPLANGLVGLGDGFYAIKHVRSVHLAARVAPDTPWVQFIDNTAPDTAVTWVFEVVQGTAGEALKIANGLNIHPTVLY